jgi:hypothetical protein
MTLQLHLKTFVKNSQTRKLSKTWHTMIAEKEVARNNFLATGNIKNAKRFASSVTNFKFVPVSPIVPAVQPTVIFSRDMLNGDYPQYSYLS